MLEKLKQWAWLAALGFGLAFAFFWWRSDVADAELARMRAENAIRFAAIESDLQQYRLDNEAKQAQIESLLAANAQLAKANVGLVRQVSSIRAERDRRVREIPDLPVQAVVAQTLEELKLEPPEIRPTADSLIVFTPGAGKVNLEQLVLGTAARRELELASQRISNLEIQLANDAEVISGQQEIIANKDAEIAALTERFELREAELKQEIVAVKAKARKRNLLYGVLGFIGGVAIRAIGF